MEDRTVESFNRALKKLKSLQKISLGFYSCKDLSDVGLLLLIEGLEELVFLKSVCLYFDECRRTTEAGIDQAKERLRDCSSILEINISKYVRQRVEN